MIKKIKFYIIEKLIDYLIPTKQEEIDGLEELLIYNEINKVDRAKDLFKATINFDKNYYYKIKEDDINGRLLRKGMIVRTQRQLMIMETASDKIKQIKKQNK